MNQKETNHQDSIQNCLQAINNIILGKTSTAELALATLLAEGSILIEDRPGLGKTTLAKTLSKALNLSFQRIQCTNDLLPMDILGRFDYSNKESPRFIEGPLFASIVILDELNRAPSRTQSAFLQAMEEGEVSLEGKTFTLPSPQMFIATQNPSDQIGTSFLPESELDRFTLKLELGVPSPQNEKIILQGIPQQNLAKLESILSQSDVLALQEQTKKIRVSDSFIELVVRFLNHSREKSAFLSPRAGQDLIKVSQALALIRNRDYVTPDDLKSCMKPVICHRIRNADGIIQSFTFEI